MIIKDAVRITLSLSAQRLLNENSAARRGKRIPDEEEALDMVEQRISQKLKAMLNENELHHETDIQLAAEEDPNFGETLFGLRAWLELYHHAL